jgi:hypothetical protein
MCLRFVFLLVTRLAAWSWLCRREECWKNAEILLLRHQLAILRRQPRARPKPSWADRALIAALLGVVTRARWASPPMGSQVPAQTAWAPGDPPQCPQPGALAGARESRVGLPQDSR